MRRSQTFAAAGERNKPVETLDELTRRSKQKYVAPYFFAEIPAGLGRVAHAIEHLEKS
jgi:hypothetical protein